MASLFFSEIGNDTIDRYPLCASGVLKILCVTPAIGSEIYKAFESFRRLLKQPAVPRKEQTKVLRPKPVLKLKQDIFQAAYEPTRAISCNDADRRRWGRVKEWFNDHPTTENFNSENEKGHIIELLQSH